MCYLFSLCSRKEDPHKLPVWLAEDLKVLITDCLKYEPTERPRPVELLVKLEGISKRFFKHDDIKDERVEIDQSMLLSDFFEFI